MVLDDNFYNKIKKPTHKSKYDYDKRLSDEDPEVQKEVREMLAEPGLAKILDPWPRPKIEDELYNQEDIHPDLKDIPKKLDMSKIEDDAVKRYFKDLDDDKSANSADQKEGSNEDSDKESSDGLSEEAGLKNKTKSKKDDKKDKKKPIKKSKKDKANHPLKKYDHLRMTDSDYSGSGSDDLDMLDD